ncbi:PQQ-binding-like beta-propeller repeat protein [Cellulomonas sp. DKR-3]|uniref:PQQ-binding-like beta-propeller repeat protein n=1 Tax=Cellulomonas fulva TaxID=2835530 RepID=A0ABS5TY80_9CELL|nr:PQQ-binding-like beta-propeller repeat protein [Cellulomonas fulva]MBT0994109.1 PQQ-binding-like beta-propeller repeat protein [Cellulomonas fulva]
MTAMQRVELEDDEDVVAPRRRRDRRGEDARASSPGDGSRNASKDSSDEATRADGTSDEESLDGVLARRRVRRGTVAVLAGALVLVLGLVVGQGVLDARERASVARWAALPGTVRPLGDVLTAGLTLDDTWWPTSIGRDEDRGVDVAFGVRTAQDGAIEVVARRLPDGDQLWATPIGSGFEARLGAGSQGGSWCERHGPADAAPLVCLVTDRYRDWDDEGNEAVHEGSRAAVAVLDPADGTERARWDVPLSDGFALLGGVAALWTIADDGAVDVRAYDVATGREAWSRSLEPPPGLERLESFGSQAGVYPAGDDLQVQWYSETPELVVLDADGGRVPVPDGFDYVERRAGDDARYFVGGDHGQIATTRTGPDDVDVEVKGSILWPAVDDGSLGDLLLTDFGGLTSWDPRTGRELWVASTSQGHSLVVLGGVLYWIAGGDVVAADGTTGDELWRRTVIDAADVVSITTDGERIYVVANNFGYEGDTPRAAELAAVSLDGEELHEVSLPEGTTRVEQLGPYLWAVPNGDAGQVALLS